MSIILRPKVLEVLSSSTFSISMAQEFSKELLPNLSSSALLPVNTYLSVKGGGGEPA